MEGCDLQTPLCEIPFYLKYVHLATEEEEEGSDEDAPPGSYRGQVTRKLWFNDTALHSAMLELLLRLLVTPQGGLDTAYIQVRVCV